MKLSNIFKIKFLDRIPVLKKSKLGTIKCNSYLYKPVSDHLTLSIIKSYKNPSLFGVLPYRNKFPDHIKMKKALDNIIKAVAVNQKDLIVYGYNLSDDKEIILFKLKGKKNLHNDFFNNSANEFYNDLLIKMISLNCTNARFENKTID